MKTLVIYKSLSGFTKKLLEKHLKSMADKHNAS